LTFQIRQNYPAPVGFLPEPDFCRIWKSAGFRPEPEPEPEPKSGTALVYGTIGYVAGDIGSISSLVNTPACTVQLILSDRIMSPISCQRVYLIDSHSMEWDMHFKFIFTRNSAQSRLQQLICNAIHLQ